jgi:hypothetical protein
MNFAPLSILRNGDGFTLSGELPDIATKNGCSKVSSSRSGRTST